MNGWGITHQGMVRKQNQDAFAFEYLKGDRMIALVCDGMGGARAGNVASQMAVDIFMQEFLYSPAVHEESEQQRMERSAARANGEIFHRSNVDMDCKGMGTTLVAAYVKRNEALILNEGDSRAYYITREGISRVTQDHSLVEELLRQGKISPEQARVYPHKNYITRALGAESRLNTDCFYQKMEKDSYLLLCSDGLSNMVGEQEILYEVMYGGDPGDCCQRLLEIALKRGAPDNVTVVLIQHDGSQ